MGSRKGLKFLPLILLSHLIFGASLANGKDKEICKCSEKKTAKDVLHKIEEKLKHADKNSAKISINIVEQEKSVKKTFGKDWCIGYLPANCSEALRNTKKNGIYLIQLQLTPDKQYVNNYPFHVACRDDLFGGGWSVILRRLDGRYDFNRDWHDYKYGFGNFDHEFFVGLDKLYRMTRYAHMSELLIWLERSDHVTEYAIYNTFLIDNEDNSYELLLEGYNGTSGDFMSFHSGRKFSTKNKNNDAFSTRKVEANKVSYDYTCAKNHVGGWWHSACCYALYLTDEYHTTKDKNGIFWNSATSNKQSYKIIEMMIRQKANVIKANAIKAI